MLIGCSIGSRNVTQNCAETASPFDTVTAAARRFDAVTTETSPAIGMKVTANAELAMSARARELSRAFTAMPQRILHKCERSRCPRLRGVTHKEKSVVPP